MLRAIKAQYKVKVCAAGKSCREITAEGGANLFNVLINENIFTGGYCGGNGTCGKCVVRVDGKEVSACKTTINSDITVEIPEKNGVSVVHGVKEELTYGGGSAFFAADIGTTTLAIALVADGKAVEVITADNPQRAFGADVISRIKACSEGQTSALQASVARAVDKAISELSQKYGVKCAEKLYIGGNTVMTNLFFGENCVSMGKSPYTAPFLCGKKINATELGMTFCGRVVSLPCIAPFVGGDIVADMLNVSVGGKKLLIDLGTNAEVAYWDEDKIICSSAAAGPCFEGANISCGKSATKGAIKTFGLKGGVKSVSVIGGGAADGVCGTGLIDVISELLRVGAVDPSGKLVYGERYELSKGVNLTQGDIREFQLAKAAVRAATETILEKAEVTYDDLDKVYLTGGFSAEINVASAVSCGLIAEEIKDKCVGSGGCLAGVISYAQSGIKAVSAVEKAKYIDLACDKDFVDKYIEYMAFDAVSDK